MKICIISNFDLFSKRAYSFIDHHFISGLFSFPFASSYIGVWCRGCCRTISVKIVKSFLPSNNQVQCAFQLVWSCATHGKCWAKSSPESWTFRWCIFSDLAWRWRSPLLELPDAHCSPSWRWQLFRDQIYDETELCTFSGKIRCFVVRELRKVENSLDRDWYVIVRSKKKTIVCEWPDACVWKALSSEWQLFQLILSQILFKLSKIWKRFGASTAMWVSNLFLQHSLVPMSARNYKWMNEWLTHFEIFSRTKKNISDASMISITIVFSACLFGWVHVFEWWF